MVREPVNPTVAAARYANTNSRELHSFRFALRQRAYALSSGTTRVANDALLIATRGGLALNVARTKKFLLGRDATRRDD